MADNVNELNAESPEHDAGGAIQAILDQVEELVPPIVREHVAKRPFTFVAIGVAAGLFLGLKKGNELLSAGAAMIGTAIAANLKARILGDDQ